MRKKQRKSSIFRFIIDVFVFVDIFGGDGDAGGKGEFRFGMRRGGGN